MGLRDTHLELINLGAVHSGLATREMKKDYNTSTYIPVAYPGEPHDQTNMQTLMIKTKDNDFMSENEFYNLRKR